MESRTASGPEPLDFVISGAALRRLDAPTDGICRGSVRSAPKASGCGISRSSSLRTDSTVRPPRVIVTSSSRRTVPSFTAWTLWLPTASRSSFTPAPVTTSSVPSSLIPMPGSSLSMTRTPSGVLSRRTVATYSTACAAARTPGTGQPRSSRQSRIARPGRDRPAVATGEQLGRQGHVRRLLDVGQAAAQEVGDLGRRPVTVGRVLGVQLVDDLDQPAGISGLSSRIGPGVSSQTRLSTAMLELPRNGAGRCRGRRARCPG